MTWFSASCVRVSSVFFSSASVVPATSLLDLSRALLPPSSRAVAGDFIVLDRLGCREETSAPGGRAFELLHHVLTFLDDPHDRSKVLPRGVSSISSNTFSSRATCSSVLSLVLLKRALSFSDCATLAILGRAKNAALLSSISFSRLYDRGHLLRLLALGAVVVLPVALSYLGLQNLTGLLFRLARWPLLLLIVVLVSPYCTGTVQAAASRAGSGSASEVPSPSGSLAISSALLSWYLASFADYNATYGSLGAGIGMMMWMWISAIVVLFGAQLNSEIEHQTARDSTIQDEKPLGARGAVMADTIGKAQ